MRAYVCCGVCMHESDDIAQPYRVLNKFNGRVTNSLTSSQMVEVSMRFCPHLGSH